jgi:hypothetical protein
MKLCGSEMKLVASMPVEATIQTGERKYRFLSRETSVDPIHASLSGKIIGFNRTSARTSRDVLFGVASIQTLAFLYAFQNARAATTAFSPPSLLRR